MKYTIKPSLAALVVVYAECFPLTYGERSTTFICASSAKPLEKGIGCSIEFSDLPITVRSEINRFFGTMFALPIGQRGEFVKSFADNPIVVEVD